MPYIGKSPTQAVRARYYYTVASGATSVTGSDDNSNTLIFSDGEFVDVSLNGVTLVAGTDYVTTTANTIGSLSAMSANDVVEVVVYDVFSVFDGNVNSDFSVGGDLTVTGETVFTSDIRVGSISGNKNIIIHPANNSDARLLFREGGNIASGFNEYSIGMDGSADEITIATQGGGVITRISDNGEITFSAEDPANASFNTFNSSAKTINNYKGTTDGSAFTASSSNTTTALAADNAKGQIGTVTNHPLEIRTNNTVRMQITNAGLVGIGTSSPDGILTILTGNSDTIPRLRFQHPSTTDDAAIDTFQDANGQILSIGTNSFLATNSAPTKFNTSNEAAIQQFLYEGNIAFSTAAANSDLAERMRIVNDGRVLIGTTVLPSGSAGGSGFEVSNHGRRNLFLAMTTTNDNSLCVFLNPNGIVGQIRTSGTATSFVTSSDYRLKENIVTDWDATSRLKQLKPSRFNFKTDADKTVDGFLAHEVQSIVPEAISGTKDETRTVINAIFSSSNVVIAEKITKEDWEKGKIEETYPSDSTWSASKVVPKYQGIDQSKLVPLLVKTIQELEARITALEG